VLAFSLKFFFLVGSCHLLLSLSVTPTGPSPSLAIRQSQQHQQQQQQQQQGIALCGRWHFGSRLDSVQKGIAGHSGEDDHPQQDGDRPLHEILHEIHESTTNNNSFHSLDRDAAVTTTTRTTAAADAIQCYPLTTPTTIPTIPDLSNPHSGEPGGKFDSQLDPPTHFSLY
jgi:hypothetical protein